MRPQLIALTLALSATLPVTAQAAWTLNGVPLCLSANDQNRPIIISDGAGGSIVTWYDFRTGNADIYVQRLDAFGNPLWAANGVVLCNLASDQRNPRLVSDGAGGAIVTWEDGRNGVDNDVYAQRVNAAGVPQWTANGVPLCTAADGFYVSLAPMIASDGAGGAIVAWRDYRSGSSDIYVRRVNAAGVPQWTANGVPLCTAPVNQDVPMIISDDAGGAIVAWHDLRNGVNFDVYARRVNASGVPQWAADGVAICTDAAEQLFPNLTSDNAGGAIVTWQDTRGTVDIYAQRVNGSGAAQWAVNGIVLCNAAGSQELPIIDSDGAGGAIVAWRDVRNGFDYDIYAQRVDATGAPQWFPNGVALCTASGSQDRQTIASDGAGGAIVTWDEVRTATYDVYAQRVSASGTPVWTPNGIAVSIGAGDAQSPTIAPNGAGGAMITWNDSRYGTYDIFAQRLEGRYGEFGLLEPTVVSAADNPADQGGKIILRWRGSGRDRFDDPHIALYSIWRSTTVVAASAAQNASSEVSVISDPREIGPDFAGAAIWTEMTPAGPEYWEWIANQNATYQSTYSITASTRQDSVATNPATHYFKVIAHESASPQTRMWESASVSARSVDNLAPAAPLMLIAQRAGANVNLHWNRAAAPDLRDYSIYRATSSGVMPVPIHFLSSSDDTLAVDAGAPTSALYYIVTAHDVHANQSAPSNEASVGATTGVGHTPSLTALTVLENMPNPFTATTTLRVGLPKAGDVEIDVFDVAGRRVGGERTPALAAGWREIAFDARDTAGRALPSGVYFYRVKAAGETITRKMVIAR
jgi:hypothetical protein